MENHSPTADLDVLDGMTKDKTSRIGAEECSPRVSLTILPPGAWVMDNMLLEQIV